MMGALISVINNFTLIWFDTELATEWPLHIIHRKMGKLKSLIGNLKESRNGL
ncbi:uncharacterized protein DS421_3g84690 [Arachis hypogaea]|nr:uncharacterized protein DS421_3g84690 [Arachis hypogaea]